MTELHGKGASSGIACGEIRFYRRNKNTVTVKIVSDASAELARWREAAEKASSQLSELSEGAAEQDIPDAAKMFEMHGLILADPNFVDAVESRILGDRVNAEAAVDMACRHFSDMIASMESAYIRERSADIDDISARLINILSGRTEQEHENDHDAVIIAADDLSPSETASLDRSGILGFILSNGSSNSHTAILARTFGIPAVIGVGDSLGVELDGKYVAIDGGKGLVVIDPDEATKERMVRKLRREEKLKRTLESLRGQPDITADGKEVKVYANIASVADVDAVIDNDAAGIGLFRSEFLCVGANGFPSGERQFEAYKSVVTRMSGREVIIRTLDIGADKNDKHLGLEREENPALGMRGIRLCLSRPDIFKTQLRALYRASAFGRLSIMFPMVCSLWEVREAKKLCAEVRRELKREGIPFDRDMPIGVMIETPAAVMIADELASEVSFFSIGTNDLTQYTLAADRGGRIGASRFYDAAHPAVMKMIELTVKAAHEQGIWAGICGEMASDLSLTESFVKMGVDEISVAPRNILPLRNAVRNSRAE